MRHVPDETSGSRPDERALPAPGELALPRDWSPERGLDARQAEAVRKMLLAVANDPRSMVVRLEEQLTRLRLARDQPGPARERLALETRVVFAPLANRLGAGELKWQLEDFAFRYLEPQEYHRIAAALQEKRVARERHIEALREIVRRELEAAGIVAEIQGRAKHIYSIHRKMQRKRLPFEKVFDICALRIVVETVRDCYSALGVVHGLWPYVPGEFDDYIATPKANHYRSIHTAVVGPEGRHVEVQIRTREMHDQAESGGATHWKYKEGAHGSAEYDRKIAWARRLLAPQENTDPADRDFLERMRAELFTDRVYVLTPKGEVIELPRGGTPLDFAYMVHTGLGHRCKGAKVNGRIVPLTCKLSNGEVVEIITGKMAAPSRHWLLPAEGYLASARNRAKVRAWFKKLDESESAADGPALPRPVLAARPASPVKVSPPHARAGGARSRMPVLIEGLDDLPVTLARCCVPVRPQPITAYVTLSRGVTVHRNECAGLARMRALKPERVLRVAWNEASG